MSVSPLRYSLELSPKLPWNESQLNSLTKDYPFPDIETENAEQYVQRTYLQFLWLPHSIMSLNLLVSSLRRVNFASSSSQTQDDVHPLHELLEPILATTRGVSNKYHVELDRILADGGGSEDTEEVIMWYAVNSQKAAEDTNTEEPWLDAKWKARLLDMMERKEVQVQILLYFLKLSLPGRAPEVAKASSKKRRRSEILEGTKPPSSPTRETYLESFMDKLAMWQLVGGLDMSPSLNTEVDERDWTQIFCEDFVEPEFKESLPELCALLRSKVFPNSPFSEDEDDSLLKSSSPPPEETERSRETSKSRALARHPSVLRIPSDPKGRISPVPSSASTAVSYYDEEVPLNDDQTTRRTFARSRSLSVSLAQEKERAASVGTSTAGTKRRLLNREVSMSRVFKPGGKTMKAQAKEEAAARKKEETAKLEAAAAHRAKSQSAGMVQTLVAETPVANRTLSQPQAFVQPRPLRPLFGARSQVAVKEEDNDDEWTLQSSPDVLLLKASTKESEEHILADETPVKKRTRRK